MAQDNQDKLKVLLIEHDPGFARYAGEMLQQTHDLLAEVRLAADLDGGLSALSEGHCDVVILDMSLPDGAGLANIGLLQAHSPQVPIIVAGDSVDETLALEAIHAGAHDYLVKAHLTPGWLERSIHYAIEKHRMDRTLLEAEEKYHGLFDHLVEGIFRTTPDGRYLMANAALARIYRYASPQELIESITDISTRLYVREGRRAEFIQTMQQDGVISDFESQIYRKDGSTIWISENCQAIRDSAGRLLYYEGTVEDITQRREAEEKLRHSEGLYHSLVETLPQNIFRKNLRGEFTFANGHFCRSVGRTPEEVVGKTDFDFYPAELAKKYRSDDRHVLTTGELFETVEEYQPPGGTKIHIHVVKTPIHNASGEIIGLQGIFWDITQQRRAEEKIQQANAAMALSREEIRAKNQQMEEDLAMAREIQLAMLPQQYPAFPRSAAPSESAFQFTHRYLPTGTVGGDFFTISALSDTQAAVFLCDVAGHSVRSALVTAMIRALVEELKPLATNPGEFLSKLNVDLCAILSQSGTPLLTTAFYLVADSRSGTVRYANAGHPKPLHVRRSGGQVVPLVNASGGSQPALGLLDGIAYRSSEAILSPGDLILLFTDGLVEVQGPSNEFYTQALLTAAVERRLKLPASQLCDEILGEVRQFAGGAAFGDDVCLVGMDFPGEEPAKKVLLAERTSLLWPSMS